MPTVYVPLDRVLDNPFNTRSHYDPEAVAELADSIERDGQLQTPVARLTNAQGKALLVNAHTMGEYDGDVEQVERHNHFVQLAYGHTRARAWRHIWDRRAGDLVAGAGIHGCPEGCMPVELRPLSDDAMERLAWEENEKRRDLDPVDRARAIYDRGVRHNWTHAEAAEALGLDRTTVSNILRWFQTFHEGPFRGVGHWVLARMRRGEVSESKARALVKAFQVAADNREAYRSVWNRLTSLSALAAAAVEYDSAADLRDEVEAFVAEVETRALALRREREPEMFDDAVLDQDEPDAPSAPEIVRDEAETPDPVLDQDDGYDDGGAGLRRAAEALGETPFDQANDSTEAAGLGEAAGEGADPVPFNSQEEQDRLAAQEAQEAAEWQALERAVCDVLRTVPEPAREVLDHVIPYAEAGTPVGAHRWQVGAAFAIVAQAEMAFQSARDVAEAWGVEVEWPDPDVSPSDTADVGVTDVSADTPEAEPEPERLTHAAIGPDEAGHPIVLGLGADPDRARAEAEHHGRGEWEIEGVYPCSPELARRVEAEGGHDIYVSVRGDGVVDFAPEPDDEPEAVALEPYQVRALAYEGVATAKSILGTGHTDIGVERFFEYMGYQWAVVPRLQSDEADDAPLRWNAMLVETGIGLGISAETPDGAEAEAREKMDRQGRGKMEDLVTFSRRHNGVVNRAAEAARLDEPAEAEVPA